MLLFKKQTPANPKRMKSTSSRDLTLEPFKLEKQLSDLTGAVIDGKRQMVKKILERCPESELPDLLLVKQADLDRFLEGIQSQLTWQTFCVEQPLSMALKRNQVEMVKILLPYYKKCCDVDQLREIWEDAEAARQKQKRKTAVFDFSLVRDAISSGTSVEEHPDVINFREFLLPKEAIKLDEYYDIHDLLLLAYKEYDYEYCETYNDEYNNLQLLQQRLQFCVTVIGFLQSLLPPEYAKILCAELNKKNEKSLCLKCGTPFYRTFDSSKNGMGFKYFAIIDNDDSYAFVI